MSRRYPVLTAADLKAADACPEQVDRFRATFPKGARLTAAALRKAQAAGLNVSWAERLLDGPAWAAYKRAIASAWEEYERAVTPAWAAYKRAIAPAREEYERAVTPAMEEYERAATPAMEEYDRTIAPAMEEYERAVTPAWAAYKRAIAPAMEEYEKTVALALLVGLRATLTRQNTERNKS